MKLIKPPVKPFENYKWRWAVLTPTETLNDPPVFLGVLRVFNKYQNYAPGSKEVMEGLAIVQTETNTSVNLVRDSSRNLVRNSGQYWKALGLLEDAHGKISVSPFGQLLAEGKITQVEFATTVIKTLELPNKRIMSDVSEWEQANLKIKPLELILNILLKISERYGINKSFITPFELVRIVIPLAGAKTDIEDYADAVIQFRDGIIDISKWPNCATSDNDERMAREFLIFLTNYGFCKREQSSKGNKYDQFSLASISKEEVIELHKLHIEQEDLSRIVKQIRITQIPATVERKRVFREVLERPHQNIFRKNILNAFNFTCVITGVNIDNVLEASHIIPVCEKGSDQIGNGLCLRSDIHQLFDSGHLKLLPSGDLILSELAEAKNNYSALNRKIQIPDFVNRENLNWRIKYY